ncbi:MAG: GNAT family N-acetyltransferase [Myxococcaceae bacterium]|nr:GNAT family N-acetyltransferase [Myxococcaceae bacterium]
MTDAELASRLRANLIAYRQLQAAHGSLRALTLPGVWAYSLPDDPELTRQQQILFEEAEALEPALAPLEDFYRGQHIQRWQVQVPPGNAVAEHALSRAGYQPGELVPAMGLSLVDTPPVAPRIVLEPLHTQEELSSLNAEAFGLRAHLHLSEWYTRPHPSLHPRGVREGGRLIAGGLAFDLQDTTGIYLVATVPHARGRGLASEVMRGLLVDAHARGRAAAVLQSTEMGHGIYLRMGFRDLGTWTSWVRQPLC